MKKHIWILLIVLLPVFLLGSIPDFYSLFNFLYKPRAFGPDRTWRLNQYLLEDYEDNAWEYDLKAIYVYNQTFPTRIDTLKMYFYNSTDQSWVLGVRLDYTYAANHDDLMQVDYIYIISGNEMPVFRYEMEYNSQHRLILTTVNSYNFAAGIWSLMMWMKMFYNTNSLNSMVGYVAADEEPQQWTHNAFTNDGQGRPAYTVSEVSADSVSWVNDNRTEYTYHPNDTSTGEDYIEGMKHMFFTYESAGAGFTMGNAMLSETTDYNWNNSWENDWLDVYTYDGQNRLIEQVEYTWAGYWESYERYQYSYDANNNLHQSLKTEWNGMDWHNSQRYTYTWGLDTAIDDDVIPSIAGIRLQPSPNPFSSDVSIRIMSKTSQPVELNIYNVRGQLIRTLQARANVPLAWDGRDEAGRMAASGIYLLRAVCGKESDAAMILKLR